MRWINLPGAIIVLLSSSCALSLIALAIDLINLGEYSYYVIPIATFLTILHHITLIVLSTRKVVPPPLAHAANSSPISQSRTLVDDIASPNDIPLEENGARTIRGRRVHAKDTKYPSYTINVANCTIVFLLALLWAGGSWIPGFMAGGESFEPRPTKRIIPHFEAAFGYFEFLVLLWLFGLCVHHRKKHLRAQRLIPMNN
jgi:hypothetical protein